MTKEQLMERCVDGELTSAQRQELLQQLEESPDGWKQLACLYMEDQLYGQAVSDHAVLPKVQSKPTLSEPRSVATSGNRIRKWFAHPVTSVALCLCVAFLSGMVLNQGADGTSPGMTASLSATRTEFPEAMKNALNQMGYNQTPVNLQSGKPTLRDRSPRVYATSVKDEYGRAYLRLRSGTIGFQMPMDQVTLFFP